MAINQRLFRKEALDHRGQGEAIDYLSRVTAPHEWAVLAGLGLALLGVIAWGLFGSVERSLEADCVLARPGERYTVIAEVTGNIVEVLAGVGDPIKARQPIARITNTPELRHQIALAQTRVTALEAKPGQDPSALNVAREELLRLEATQASGEFIRSPYQGEIVKLALVPGEAVAAGSEVAVVLDSPHQGLEAFALLPLESVRHVDVGMEAQVLTSALNQGSSRAFGAEVSYISDRPVTPPGWLVGHHLSPPGHSYMVKATLLETPPPTMVNGTPCSFRVVLRKDPPVRLLRVEEAN